MQPLDVIVLTSDSQDMTHFHTEALAWHSSRPLPTNQADDPTTAMTDLLPASQVGFLHMRAGYQSDWHPAPRKQYVLVLTGTMAVQAGDNEMQTFSPGSVLLVTDTHGRGHKTSVVGTEDVTLAWVPVP